MAAHHAFDIFSQFLCKHSAEKSSTTCRQRLIRLAAFFLSPLAPALLLANVAYYNERVATAKRDLQADTLNHIIDNLTAAAGYDMPGRRKIDARNEKKLVTDFLDIQKDIYQAGFVFSAQVFCLKAFFARVFL